MWILSVERKAENGLVLCEVLLLLLLLLLLLWLWLSMKSRHAFHCFWCKRETGGKLTCCCWHSWEGDKESAEIRIHRYSRYGRISKVCPGCEKDVAQFPGIASLDPAYSS